MQVKTDEKQNCSDIHLSMFGEPIAELESRMGVTQEQAAQFAMDACTRMKDAARQFVSSGDHKDAESARLLGNQVKASLAKIGTGSSLPDFPFDDHNGPFPALPASLLGRMKATPLISAISDFQALLEASHQTIEFRQRVSSIADKIEAKCQQWIGATE